MVHPKVSVILPVFNGRKYLFESVESILQQTFKDFELIIINDASTDNTLKLIESKKDNRIRVINNSKNVGVTKSLNRGLEQATGEYIARCDSDDLNTLDRFKKQVEFLDSHADYVLVGSNALWIDEAGKEIKGFTVPETNDEIRKKLLFRNQFFHPSVMIRSSALAKTGFYREFFNGAEDYELWFRLIKIGKVYNFPEKLIKRRVHQDVVTQKKHWKIEILAILVRIMNILS